MSQWRREASLRLPELQRIIASRDIKSPMRMWIELTSELEKRALKASDAAAVDLFSRMWGYAEWCLKHRDGDVMTAAALGFCEDLLRSPETARLLPRVMSRSDFRDIRSLLEYHNTAEEIDTWENRLWGASPRRR